MKKSLKFKIFKLFLILILIFAFSNVWSLLSLNNLSKSINSIMESNYRSIEAAQQMIVAIERQDSAELEHMFSQSTETIRSFNENQKIFIGWLTRAEDNVTEEGESEIIDMIGRGYDEYLSSFTQLLLMDNKDSSVEVNNYYYNTILPLFEKTKNYCRDLLSLNQTKMIESKDRSLEVSERTTIITIIISIFTVLLGLYSVAYLSRKIVKPIYDFIEKTKMISDGDYNQKLLVSGNDELARMAYEFNVMAEKLSSYKKSNISMLKQEKNRSEAIVNSISDGILVTDEDSRIILLNQKAERIFKVRERDAIGKHLLEVIDDQRLFESMKNADQHNRKYDNLEIEDKESGRYYIVNARPVRMQGMDSIGSVALIQDITKMKEVETMKSEFISTVSHEFRTPLTSIIMGVGLLQEPTKGELNEKQTEIVNIIKDDSERLNKLVGELLDLSKFESGKIDMDIQRHDINKIVDYVIDTFKLQSKEINAVIEKKIPGNFKDLNVDFNKITWVLTNLAGNALRYIPRDGTGRILIEAKEIRGKALISVKDNGSGISDEYKEKIFSKFVQGKNGGKAGLGLAICKEIVKAHGGDIWVESKLDEGSVFSFTVNTIE